MNSLPTPSAPSAATESSKRKPKWPWIAGGVAALVVIGAATQGAGDSKTNTGNDVAVPAVEAPTADDAATDAEALQADAPEPPAVEAPAADAGAMPDVVGMSLQEAQDHIQAVTDLWYSDSSDATGEGRMQVMDSNWVVVGQTPPVGTALSEDDVPMLDVVKYGEAGF